MSLPFRLALLTYANAALVYGLVTYPETGAPLAALAKVARSLWWLIPLATPFALLFALAGAPIVRAAHKRAAHLGRWPAGALATLAFLIPAATVAEIALAARDGLSPARFLVQVAAGLTLAGLWGLTTQRTDARPRDPSRPPGPDLPDE
jgi:hypothetical protein